jgi:hypothetical protein
MTTPGDRLEAEDAIILAMCKAHDREESAQIGEPSPWREDFDRDPDWEQSRFLAMREAFDEARALLSPEPEGEPVAWRWRWTSEAYGVEGAIPGAWKYSQDKPDIPPGEAWKKEVLPLYASPVPAKDLKALLSALRSRPTREEVADEIKTARENHDGYIDNADEVAERVLRLFEGGE